MNPPETATAPDAQDNAATEADGVLLNPATFSGSDLEATTAEMISSTIGFFEERGKLALKDADRDDEWYGDFLAHQGRERIWARLLTPTRDAAAEGAGDATDKRWDTWRNCAYNEVTAFYGLAYWYTWQVSILGLGPILQSDNEAARHKAARALEEGKIFAFGLSEREHGADIYSTDMVAKPDPEVEGGYRVSGGKYYIGNGNEAAMVSVFGRVDGIDGPDGYIFFVADSQHANYKLIRNVVNSQSYVSQFELENYPVAPEDILFTGPEAFNAALNTVNIGKFNLGFASIGICTHALYESITHADNRVLYGIKVTDFPHVSQAFTDGYSRLVAMKLFGQRSIDYMRSANADDRRYLLYNPLTKMKVTTEGEKVIDAFWDVMAAKGFEKDMYFEMAARDIRALPKLEGTVHVNMALVLKFMAGFLFNSDPELAPVDQRRDDADDEFLFHQGPTRGLSKIRFHEWRPALEAVADRAPNVGRFIEQADALIEMLQTCPPDEAQQKDLDFLLTLGELFTLIPYAQLICEQAELTGLADDTLDQIFDVLVRDYSAYAIELHGKTSSTEAQQAWALSAIRKPIGDSERFGSVWAKVRGLAGAYEMAP